MASNSATTDAAKRAEARKRPNQNLLLFWVLGSCDSPLFLKATLPAHDNVMNQ